MDADERLRLALDRVSAALREVVEELQVTDAYDVALVPATSKEGAGDGP
jgi:hypothetical protein